jgi:hypothetical protein
LPNQIHWDHHQDLEQQPLSQEMDHHNKHQNQVSNNQDRSLVMDHQALQNLAMDHLEHYKAEDLQLEDQEQQADLQLEDQEQQADLQLEDQEQQQVIILLI